MKKILLIPLFICFSCDSPTDTDGNGDSNNNIELVAITDEQLAVEFSSCYGSDLEDRAYTLADASFEGKGIVIQYVTPW